MSIAMSNTFQFELVSPEKILVSKSAVMVTVPGGEGEYGVLAGHAPLITTVKAGVINVYANDDTTISDRLFVAGGVAEVTGERCTVLAEEALPVADIDRAKVEACIRDLTEDVANAKSDIARVAAEEKLAIAQAKITALAA
jgi:F-type H+-transporting ATPase subunit epsilon